MNRFVFLPLLAVLFALTPAHGQGKKFVLFASFLENTPVTLEDGGRWIMDKGDTFPVLMFKEQQTQVVLQLAGTSFRTPAKQVRIVQEKEVTEEMLATYRKNVETYLDGKARQSDALPTQ